MTKVHPKHKPLCDIHYLESRKARGDRWIVCVGDINIVEGCFKEAWVGKDKVYCGSCYRRHKQLIDKVMPPITTSNSGDGNDEEGDAEGDEGDGGAGEAEAEVEAEGDDYDEQNDDDEYDDDDGEGDDYEGDDYEGDENSEEKKKKPQEDKKKMVVKKSTATTSDAPPPSASSSASSTSSASATSSESAAVDSDTKATAVQVTHAQEEFANKSAEHKETKAPVSSSSLASEKKTDVTVVPSIKSHAASAKKETSSRVPVMPSSGSGSGSGSTNIKQSSTSTTSAKDQAYSERKNVKRLKALMKNALARLDAVNAALPQSFSSTKDPQISRTSDYLRKSCVYLHAALGSLE